MYRNDKALIFPNKQVKRVELIISSEYYVASLHDSVDIMMPGFHVKAGYEMSDSTLIYNQEIWQTGTYLMADKFEEFNKVLRSVSDFGKLQVVIKLK